MVGVSEELGKFVNTFEAIVNLVECALAWSRREGEGSQELKLLERRRAINQVYNTENGIIG